MKRKLLRLLALLTLLFLAAVGLLIGSGMNDHLGKADVALVLGNQVYPNGTPSLRLKARLDKTILLYQAGYFPKIIVSGATGIEGVPEGTAMQKYLLAAGIPASAIIVDDQGIDTHASAQNTAAILQTEKLKSVFVITQYFHIPRCKLALSKLGIAPIFNAHPAYFEARDLYSTLRELPAYLKYLLRSA